MRTYLDQNAVVRVFCLAFIVSLILSATNLLSPSAFAQSIVEPSKQIQIKLRNKIDEEKTRAIGFDKIEYSLIKTRDKLWESKSKKGTARKQNTKELSTSLIKIDDEARIQVYVYVTSTGVSIQKRLKTEGLKIEIINDSLGVIQGWLPEAALESIAELSFVKKITPPSYGVTHAGSVTSEGDGILLANELRPLGFDGTGVRVGVISDGVDNMTDAVATGDLPSGVTVFGTCTGSSTCNEGTAMLEIVHDLAPGTELVFGAKGTGTTLEFISRIDDLEGFGASIIIDDIGFFGEPYFEDGPVAERVGEAVGSGIVYVSSAGNYAEKHYEAEYIATGSFHDFGVAVGAASDLTMDVLLAAGATLTGYLQWNDQFGTSGNDYDLLLFDDSETLLLASSESVQNGNDDPFETLTFTNPLGETIRVKAVIRKFSGITRQLEMFVLGGTIEEYGSSSGSIFGHKAVPSSIAVGAIDANDVGSDTIESFSSQGPSEIYFPSRETRQKPDITAIDNVLVTGAGGFSNPFLGTSAAAPHIAGLAALLMDVSPTATSADIRNALTNSAVDLGATGFDTIFGAGRADVFSAAELLNTAPQSTIDAPTSDASIKVGESVTFSGTCTDANSRSGMTSVWSFGDGSGLASLPQEDPGALVFNTAGTFTITFTCNDGFGVADLSPATKTITVSKLAEMIVEDDTTAPASSPPAPETPSVPASPAPTTPSKSPSEEPDESATSPAAEPSSSAPASGGCSLILET